jgi:hypothetical protein
MEFTAEFTVIGEDQDSGETEQIGPATPGSLFPIDQNLFEESGDGSWAQGSLAGEAHGFAAVTRRSNAMCVITFQFESGTLVVQGLLPSDGRALSDGTLAVTGGTGDFERSSGRVDMESRNPKRWTFVL